MRLYIAGGCGEHGRNCFLVEGENLCFLVDCGIMAGEENGGYPRLKKEQIKSLNCVFLTHSHMDHSGALPWLYENGFSGPVVASHETIVQCPFKIPEVIELESACEKGKGKIGEIEIEWGRSGHCVGSVWYYLAVQGKRLLFSGDYSENALVYFSDAIRGKTAELAVLDCAYGNSEELFEDYCRRLVEAVKQLLDAFGLLVFPVPKFGRGPELLSLLSAFLENTDFYGDELFVKNYDEIPKKEFWCRSEKIKNQGVSPYRGEKRGIVFLSDPQLRSSEARKTAEAIFERGGFAVMTGTAEEGSFSKQLMDEGKMKLFLYPVHQNKTGFERLKNNNSFMNTVPYHCREIAVESPIIF